MKLEHGLHLAYCTNIHRGENWDQTFASLERDVMAVREQVAPGAEYAIGLRLSDQAARELSEPNTLAKFKDWLAAKNCYVFTINGFPYGAFHGTRVKEQVYRPDWTDASRVDYTNRLFDLLAQLMPEGIEGSVSTLPGSFKEFITSEDQEREIFENFWKTIDHLDALSNRTGRDLHLGVEPEPLGWFEDSAETVRFFERLRDHRPGDSRCDRFLGVNYDTCHLAVEHETPGMAIGNLRKNGIFISKLHLSSALKVRPGAEVYERLQAFADDTYLHQVIARKDGKLLRARDLDVALAEGSEFRADGIDEWRIHFHIPLHSPASDWFENTADHILGTFDLLRDDHQLCRHLEMETYTWEVLPEAMKSRNVVDQLVEEYRWTLKELRARGIDSLM